ncbi:DUF4198 domain-containing protein [Nostoc sp. FACHB-888]|uniref:DUF4198 domain-containing protein n=1 Tax=Nostoc sp. FACHB-888 TaxID=2692842 RepID=UPI001686A7B1|nr:DUF4198 domain-containing protein [Nostoc sp. FACHB-888]MBD2247516.1 DUF4198 domain-containing protein [Nostoc sp. FACHB-888]
MFTKKWKELLLAVAMLPLFIQPVSAHIIWFNYNNGEYDLLFGHPEDGPEPYQTFKFKQATAYDSNRQILPFDINQKKDGLSLTSTSNSEIAALTGFFDNGYYAKVGDESRSISEQEIGQYQDVSHYLKYTKALFDWSDTLAQPFNLPLEIISLQNPLTVKPGENLKVQVLYEGKQIPDVTVEYLGKKLTGDQDGTYLIPIGDEGLQQIEASYTVTSGNQPSISYETGFTAQTTSVPESSALLGLGVIGLLGLYKKRFFA